MSSVITDDLCRVPLFKNASAEFFGKIKTFAHAKIYEKGRVLFLSEDTAQHFYIIEKGWVKLFRETVDGTQAVVDIITSGHVFGDAAIFNGNIYPYSAETVETAVIVALPLSALKDEIEANPRMALDMLNLMAQHNQQQDREIEHRTLQDASQRIGCFLLRLVQQDAQGKVSIQLPYDKMLVAARLGMQPETFSRALSKLRDKTGLRIKGATIELDSIRQLSDYTCTACSSEFPCNDLKKSMVSV